MVVGVEGRRKDCSLLALTSEVEASACSSTVCI